MLPKLHNTTGNVTYSHIKCPTKSLQTSLESTANTKINKLDFQTSPTFHNHSDQPLVERLQSSVSLWKAKKIERPRIKYDKLNAISRIFIKKCSGRGIT